MKALQSASFFLLAPLAHCLGTNRLVVVGFFKTGSSIFGRGPFQERCVGDLDPSKQSKLQLTMLPFATLIIDQGTKWQGGPFWVGQNGEKELDPSANIWWVPALLS